MPQRAIIVAARRTPIGRKGGVLRRLTVEQLAAPVLQALLTDAGVSAADVDDVILGNAAGPGGNPARVALLAAGLPVSVPGMTVDRQCGSGLEAINLACRLVEAGAGQVYLAGGVESVSTAPWRLERPADLYRAPPRLYERARFAPDALGDPEMGVAAENVAAAHAIDRERQDRYALGSHEKAITAQATGRFDAEMVAIDDGTGALITGDECPRRDTSLTRLAALPPAFVAGGTVTAGNSCPLNDGAAAVVVMAEELARAIGRRSGLRFIDAAAAGVDPTLLGLGPIASTRRLLARTGLSVSDVDLCEFNEAFAAQVLACLDALALPADRVNVGGGAIALGHPFGASGAVLVVRLFSEMVRSPDPHRPLPSRALATLGIGGGQGVSTLFERTDLA
jgi:acetyl-CoA C-acetyltransferase